MEQKTLGKLIDILDITELQELSTAVDEKLYKLREQKRTEHAKDYANILNDFKKLKGLKSSKQKISITFDVAVCVDDGEFVIAINEDISGLVQANVGESKQMKALIDIKSAMENKINELAKKYDCETSDVIFALSRDTDGIVPEFSYDAFVLEEY